MAIGGELPARPDSRRIAFQTAEVWNGQPQNLGTCDYLVIIILTLLEMMKEMELMAWSVELTTNIIARDEKHINKKSK